MTMALDTKWWRCAFIVSDFVGEWRKHHGLKMKQGPPKSGGDLEGAWEVGIESGEANSTWKGEMCED